MAACLSPSARAAVLTWGAAGGGGTGNWDTSTANWYDGAAPVTWNNATPDSAVFAGTAGTVTLNTGITAGALTFTTTGYTVTGNTLTLGGGTTANVTLGTGISATIASTVSGTAALVKLGAGTLTLSSSNNYSAGTTVSAGRIVLGNDFALGSGTVTLNGGEMQRDVAGATIANAITVGASGGTIVGRTSAVDNYVTLSGQLTGSGPLTVQGLVSLSNNTNTYSGAITISNASATYFRLMASNVLGNTAEVTLGGGNARLRLDGGVTQTIGALNGTAGEIFGSAIGGQTTARLKVASGT